MVTCKYEKWFLFQAPKPTCQKVYHNRSIITRSFYSSKQECFEGHETVYQKKLTF